MPWFDKAPFMKALAVQYKLLIIIFFLALFLRLLGLINITFGGDFYDFFQTAGQIAQGKSLPLLGPSASINTKIHISPFYYYFLAIPYFLGGGNFRFAIIFFSLLNSLSVFPLFAILKRWFSLKDSFLVVILYAVSSYIIQVENFPWNPYLIPSLIIVCLYLLMKIREKYLNYLPLLFLFLGLGLSLHGTFLFIIPLFLLFIPFRKVSLKVLILSLFIFGLTLSPLVYYEINNNFIQTKELINVFSPNKEICDFSLWLKTHGNGERCFHQIRNTLFIFRLVSQSLFSTRNLAAVLVSALIIFYTLIKSKNNLRYFLLVWIFSIFIFFMFYSQNIYLHYFLILIPFPFIIFVMFLNIVKRKGKYGRLLSNIAFLTLIVWNIVSYLNSLQVGRW
jgi:4-amino-4-deoxy-L-arabinose transferase-like glycosyltransferase